jgi:hypothetical protein
MVFDDQILVDLSEEQAANSRTSGRCPFNLPVDLKAFSSSGRVCERTVVCSFNSPGVKSIYLSARASQPSRLFNKCSLFHTPSERCSCERTWTMQKGELPTP